jgi:TPR repeat protein
MKQIVIFTIILLFPFVVVAQTAEECFEKGKNYYESKDYAEAYKWFSKAADQGSAKGINGLGLLYKNGHGVTKDINKAIELYRKSAEMGYASAQRNIGIAYQYGQGVQKDYVKAVEWYKKAAEQGHADAQNNLGIMYAKGYGISKNDEEALKWYRKAAEQGVPDAQYNIGLAFEDGLGVSKDYTKAIEWYKKAADQGYAKAQNVLGYMYEHGYGVDKNYDEALKWYHKAAQQGNATAQCNIGLAYANGRGVQKDYAEAAKWYRKAAEKGHIRAQSLLGYLYLNGYGVNKDYTEALKWSRKAAEQGNTTGQSNVGVIFEKGYGVDKDIDEALKWYRKAADQNDGWAQNKLGDLYREGKEVKSDYKESVKWYLKAYENGNRGATTSLGWMYEQGYGVKKDYKQAVKLYSEAAEKGSSNAQYNMGIMYEQGRGVKQNYEISADWYRKALVTSPQHEDATRGLTRVMKKMGKIPENSFAYIEIPLDKKAQEPKKNDSKQTNEHSASTSGVALPIIDYIDNSLAFVDPTGNNVIKSNSNYKIRFQLKNSGKADAKDCQVRVNVSGDSKDIIIQDMALNTIDSGETMTIEIPVKSGANISNGQVEFAIQVDEPNGMGFDPQYLSVNTKGFEAPWVKITDYSLTGSSGKELKKKEPFDLQLMLQNTEMGQADDVSVNVELPENILLIDGTKDKRFEKLTGGEAKSLLYTLIVNNNYSEGIIPIKIHLKEKYGKYAEDRTISLTLDQTITSTKLSVREFQQQARKDITIAKIVSDVDKDIPQAEDQQENTFALIIANENYEAVDGVPYAGNDGAMFETYCRQTLGIPQEKIRCISDATLGKMRRGVQWLQDVMKNFKDSRIIFYYAGHGIPDEQSKTAYLLPTDGTGRDIKTGYALSELYQSLESLPSRSVTIFLDACFSGTKREGNMITSARGVAIKVKPNTPNGNLVVFSAAQGDETAYPYDDQRHGMFTYFLLKKLKETGGNLTLGELADYVTQKVAQMSVLKNSKPQTPTVSSSSVFANSWKNLRLK